MQVWRAKRAIELINKPTRQVVERPTRHPRLPIANSQIVKPQKQTNTADVANHDALQLSHKREVLPLRSSEPTITDLLPGATAIPTPKSTCAHETEPDKSHVRHVDKNLQCTVPYCLTSRISQEPVCSSLGRTDVGKLVGKLAGDSIPDKLPSGPAICSEALLAPSWDGGIAQGSDVPGCEVRTDQSSIEVKVNLVNDHQSAPKSCQSKAAHAMTQDGPSIPDKLAVDVVGVTKTYLYEQLTSDELNSQGSASKRLHIQVSRTDLVSQAHVKSRSDGEVPSAVLDSQDIASKCSDRMVSLVTHDSQGLEALSLCSLSNNQPPSELVLQDSFNDDNSDENGDILNLECGQVDGQVELQSLGTCQAVHLSSSKVLSNFFLRIPIVTPYVI